jgi:hypothetical protein
MKEEHDLNSPEMNQTKILVKKLYQNVVNDVARCIVYFSAVKQHDKIKNCCGCSGIRTHALSDQCLKLAP